MFWAPPVCELFACSRVRIHRYIDIYLVNVAGAGPGAINGGKDLGNMDTFCDCWGWLLIEPSSSGPRKQRCNPVIADGAARWARGPGHSYSHPWPPTHKMVCRHGQVNPESRAKRSTHSFASPESRAMYRFKKFASQKIKTKTKN